MELKNFQSLPDFPKEIPPASPQPRRCFVKNLAASIEKFARPQRRELIAGGDIKWKPVNQEAARLLSKSPDINKPPPMNTSSFSTQNIAACGGVKALTPREQQEIDSQTNAAFDRKIITEADKLPDKLNEHITALKTARASLDVATDLFRKDMIEFTEELPKHMKALREWRMAMEREKETSLKALRELRQFFLEDAHEKEITRLSEFIRLCERLKDLAKDGTLEKVSDVMLKLAE